MGCPRCKEPYSIEVLFDAEITYPFKRDGGNVTYDFLFLRCKSCNQEFAVRDDNLIVKGQFKEREKIKKYIDSRHLRTLKLGYPLDDMEDHCNVGE